MRIKEGEQYAEITENDYSMIACQCWCVVRIRLEYVDKTLVRSFVFNCVRILFLQITVHK